MKTSKPYFEILTISLVLSALIISCKTSEKAYVKCPDLPQARYNKMTPHFHAVKYRKPILSHSLNKLIYSRTNSQHVNYKVENTAGKNLFQIVNSDKRSGIERVAGVSRINYNRGLVASINDPQLPVYELRKSGPGSDPVYLEGNSIKPDREKAFPQDQAIKCDTIITVTGSKIIGKVIEIGQDEVKYKRCDNLDGPVISFRKSVIAEVRYSNGVADYITNPDQAVFNNGSPDTRRSEGLGIAGFLASVVGLFIAGIPLGIVGVVFGVISLGKIKKESQRYKGKGFAIAGIILGLIDIIAVLAILGGI